MKTKIIILTGIVVFLFSCGNRANQQISVGYLTVNKQFSAEDSSVYAWLAANPEFDPIVIKLNKSLDKINRVDVVWIHIPDSLSYVKWEQQLEKLKPLKSFYENGGKLLLTDFAACLPYELRIESKKPAKRTEHIENYWMFDKRGLQSFRGHPIFKGLFGGAFIWDAFEDHDLTEIGYFDDNYPDNGKVVATGKSYVFIKEKKKLAVEYCSQEGRILSVGGLIFFAKENRLRFRMEKFLNNSLNYLGNKLQEETTTYWEKFDNKPKQFTVSTNSLELKRGGKFKDIKHTGLVFKEDKPQNNFYDISGRRALVMGYQNGGIDEVWVHPFRVLRDYRAAIIVDNKVIPLETLPLTIEIRPESVTRIYKTKYGQLVEMIYPSLEKAGVIIHYEADFSETVKLFVKTRSDMRWMWPYAENALGDIYYGFDEELNAYHLKDRSEDFYCLLGSDAKPLETLSGQYKDIKWKSNKFKGEKTKTNQVYLAALYELNKANDYTLNYVVVGTNTGKNDALNDYRYLITYPGKVYDTYVSHYIDLLNNMVTIESPDKEFNTLWRWALVGTDRFFAETPGLGSAFLAGYSTGDRGWNGGHKNNGRPGYAWYFGRDAEWTCFAVDDYGDFDLVKEQLKFFQKHQDMSGKIFHELSTSGVVHYDAADATPLYIILAAHYLRASGDVEFIRESWPYIQKAMDFLYSTDTDGDRLIENKDVGHGWIEGGKLWGVNTTFYLTGTWGQALKEAAYIADYIGDSERQIKYTEDYQKIRKIINTDFWNDSTKFYNFGKFEDGSYNHEKTILPAVPMYFNLLDDDKARFMLREWAGNGFSTDWGTRIMSFNSLLFAPKGYHEGSVWPLFTGWTSLAEYEYGNSEQGFMHIVNNLYMKNYWNLGYVEEVINGVKYEPSGVCPHQCWSETNALHPGITGMVGWKPNAPEKSVELKPRFPIHWNKVAVNNLRVGNSIIRLKMNRSREETFYTFKLVKGEPVTVHFAPEMPKGMVVTNTMLDGKTVKVSNNRHRKLLNEPIIFKLIGESKVVFNHHGGVGVVPISPRPLPGEKSKGDRVIESRYEENRYLIKFEGRSGSRRTFKIKLFDQRVLYARGATVLNTDRRGVVTLEIQFPKSKQGFIDKNVILELR